MTHYQVFLSFEAMEVFREIKAKERRPIALFVQSLVSDPFQKGDFSEFDDTARKIEIKIIGRYAMTFWADTAVKEVKVTDLRRADGP